MHRILLSALLLSIVLVPAARAGRVEVVVQAPCSVVPSSISADARFVSSVSDAPTPSCRRHQQ